MTARVATVVIGLGAAGQHLLRQLAGRPELGSVLGLESRHALHDDRTWCFFADGSEDVPIRATFSHIAVRHAGRTRTLATGNRPYVCVRGGSFAQDTLARVRQAPHMTARFATPVLRLSPGPKHVTLELGGGQRIEAQHVFDSRPYDGPLPRGLWQHFEGWFVRFDAPCLDTHTAMLMDFAAPRSDAVRFIYHLPFTPSEALFENTYFSSQPHTRDDQQALLHAAVTRYAPGVPYRITRRERGVLPMLPGYGLPRHQPRIVPIGTRAGLLRPSTGYGFQAMARDARALVDAMHHGQPWPAGRPPHLDRLDAVLLDYLARHPPAGPALYAQLFERNPASRLIRFLSNESRPDETLALMRTVPTGPMLRSAFREGSLWRPLAGTRAL